MKIAVYAIWVFAIVVLTFAVHELAHGVMGAALGYDMIVTLNGARPRDSTGITLVERDLITLSGPVVTLLQGVVAAWLASVWRPAFVIALAAFLMRALAAGVSLVNPNDEARLGLSWDVGFWTLHILVIGTLALTVLIAARAAQPGWRHSAIAVAMAVVAMATVVGTANRLPAITIPAF